MVEGHQCHRLAHFHRQKLLNRAFKATSPNGRFTDGATEINNKYLTRIEVHGKNLFYFFSEDPQSTSDDGLVVLHFHFGMSGAFSIHSLVPSTDDTNTTAKNWSWENSNTLVPSKEPKPTCRLQLINHDENIAAQLSAMIVQHGTTELYHSKVATLGEDPLRESADHEAVWAKISTSKKPIGLLLMDQTVIAGIGNIYRAEILFKSGIHPEQPANTLSKSQWETIWRHSVELLRRGFETGSILTVDEVEAKVLGQPWTRRYCYNHSSCGRCGGKILSWDMASRTVYCCATCQPLVESENGTAVSEARKKAMAAAKQAKEFVSHCAPDDASDDGTPLKKMTVAALKKRAETLGLSTAGKKGDLIARLEAAEAEQKGGSKVQPKREQDGAEVAEAVPTPQPPAPKRARRTDVHKEQSSVDAAAVYPELYDWDTTTAALPKSGTAGIKHVATAREALEEKIAAGEGRGVEHVALHDDEEAAVIKRVARK